MGKLVVWDSNRDTLSNNPFHTASPESRSPDRNHQISIFWGNLNPKKNWWNIDALPHVPNAPCNVGNLFFEGVNVGKYTILKCFELVWNFSTNQSTEKNFLWKTHVFLRHNQHWVFVFWNSLCGSFCERILLRFCIIQAYHRSSRSKKSRNKHKIHVFSIQHPKLIDLAKWNKTSPSQIFLPHGISPTQKAGPELGGPKTRVFGRYNSCHLTRSIASDFWSGWNLFDPKKLGVFKLRRENFTRDDMKLP